TNERAVRTLMRAYVEMGDRVQAIREYERCRGALQSKLDLLPSKETQALYEAVRLVGSSRVSTSRSARPLVLGISNVQDQAVTHGASHQPSIAVLPFRNLSVQTGHDYAAEGLTEDLIESLSHVPGFFVISRLSTLAFRGGHRPPREIGEALDVRY